ncbi:hypothetical protein CA13_28440 [Planctomycetes bacterium CA13]|uniref:DUF1254 domain-containing protein n=1 Tax=Novipirellula herctigrandis TaxID=2527986 RepID=A0A5C5Z3F5_9BACT|nr:hypothetical protein CA13_28440 [Planctomycetes bacterium CA13]
MKRMTCTITLVCVLACALHLNAQDAESPYALKLGFPADNETIQRAQDSTDLRRAIEAFKFFYPTIATEAVIQQFEPHGAVPNKVGIIMPQDPEQQFSVANQDTPYVISVFDLKDGPIVIEVPEGPFMGLMDDHNMQWFGDMGVIGPGKGKGEKDLLVPPGYEGEIPAGYHPFYCKTWRCVFLMRVAVKSGSYDEAVEYANKLKAYPLAEAGKPSSYKIVNVKGKPAPLPILRWEKTMDYWRQLHAVVDAETAQPNHRVMLGMLAAVGIKKGEPFQPSERQAKILAKAAVTGFAEMNVAFFGNARPERLIWKDRRWEYIPLAGPLDPATKDFGTENYRDLLANDHFFFMAFGTSGGIGRRQVGNGSMYFYTPRDKTGAYLDGSKNYKLTIPGPVPAKLFWSVTVYDSETRTIIHTDQGRGAVRTMFENPEANADGSFDIYFGPTAPNAKENHWVKTIPGKGWFTFVRMYGPEKPLFDGTYKLPDIQRAH